MRYAKQQHVNLRKRQRRYHRRHAWRLNGAGLYIPHCYNDILPTALSWWDDVGFVHAKRRVIVWWQHPRHVYSDAVGNEAWRLTGPCPRENWLTEGSAKNYLPAGASRKRLVSYTSRGPGPAMRAFYDRLEALRVELDATGIDETVRPSVNVEELNWATGISLIAPLEVRNEVELTALAQLTRRLLRRECTLPELYPEYAYGRAQWQAEAEQRRATSPDHALS